MKFWNDELRICPKCKSPVQMKGEPRTECPKCRSPVSFFNYRSLDSPPELPEPRPTNIWANPTTTTLLIATAVFGLVALFAIYQHAIFAVVCVFAAIGFAAFGFLRHREALEIESRLTHAKELSDYAEKMKLRAREAAARYNYLLNTGDDRIQTYYRDLYLRAEAERHQAEQLQLKAAQDREAIKSVESRIYAMAERFIGDHLKWMSTKLRPDPENYQRRKLELEKAFDFVERVGYRLPHNLRQDSLSQLKSNYQKIVYEQRLKDEQKRINQQMREEERLQREREKALREAEEREAEIRKRLEDSLRHHRDAHSSEVEELRRQLAEAQANAERAKSMAQLTKAGHVYILSNIGSFGDNVFKIGMTRRLEPHDRVKELGDASVPFPFDVHAMISCENAPALENTLHTALTRYRVNRINLRKEYFKIDLNTILNVVEKQHGKIEYIAEPEALEFRESLEITPEELVETEAELAEIGISTDGDDE